MVENALRHLSSKLQDEMRRFEEDTISGNAKDYASYQNACGVYRGLTIANGLVMEMAQNFTREEEDD